MNEVSILISVKTKDNMPLFEQKHLKDVQALREKIALDNNVEDIDFSIQEEV